MQQKLIDQIEKIESFFENSKEGKNLNVTQEILFVLMQMIDIRDDEIVTDEMSERLTQLTGFNVDGFDQFSQDYFAKTGAFVGGYMQLLSEVMMEGEEKMQKTMEILSQHLANSLPVGMESDSIELIMRGFIQKIEFLSQSDIFQNEPMLEEIAEGMNMNNIDKILTLEPSQNIAIILGSIMGLLALVAMAKGEISEDGEWKEDNEEEIPDFDDMEEILREKMNQAEEPLYDKDELAYSLSDKPLCNLCDKAYTSKGIKRHINGCIDKNYKEKKENLSYLIIKDFDGGMFYLHIAIKDNALLGDLDSYLRDVWLECCGHMSDFSSRGLREISQNSTIGSIFSKTKKLDYTYDYGSSTNLTIEFVKSFKGKQKNIIKTLARNPKISGICHACQKKPIVAICSQCVGYEDEAYLCKKCMKEHECGIDMMLPFVNSPRLGTCAYGDWEDCAELTFSEAQKIMDEM